MTGIAFDAERSVWLLILDGTVAGIFASRTAATLALRDSAETWQIGDEAA